MAMSSGSHRNRNDTTADKDTPSPWEVVEIHAEDGKRYKVRWAGEDPKTGKPWPLTWIPNPNPYCSSQLVKEWERKKAKAKTPLASSSSVEVPRASVARSRPTGGGSLTRSSESQVPTTRKRKHPSPTNTDDNSKPSKKKKIVSAVEGQLGGDLGSGERSSAHPHHTTDREDSPRDALLHPPFEEIEMWVPTPNAKFGPPKRKDVAVRRRDLNKRRANSTVSRVGPVQTQAPSAVLERPLSLSETQIVALREEEEESQSQPQRFLSRHSPQLGSPIQTSAPAPNDPLQTFTRNARGEARGNSQKVQDHSSNQLDDDNPPDRNANTKHVSGLQNKTTKLGASENSETEIPPPKLLDPTRQSLVKPDIPVVVSPSTKSPLPEKLDPRLIENSTSGSVERLGPPKRAPLQRSSGTFAERRAFEARARLESLRRVASPSTGNLVEGRGVTSFAQESTPQPLPHLLLRRVLNSLEPPSRSQATAKENPERWRVLPSEPREAGISARSKEDMVTQDMSDQHVDISATNMSRRVNGPNPPDEVPPTTQGSTQSQSPNGSSQLSLGNQLAAALNLLHKKSEEILELQAQVNALREQPANGRVKLGDKRGSEQPFTTKGSYRVTIGIQTDEEKEAQAAFDLERAQWAEERKGLQTEADALRAGKAQALIDVEFFREQYQKASAFASSTRLENEDLLARATVAESQSVNGIAIIRDTFEARVNKLEAEVRKYKALSELLTERSRRTDDDVRYRAAIAPELRRENQRLRTRFEEKDGELDDIKDELRTEKEANTRLRRLVARLEAEGQANSGNSHGREPHSLKSDLNGDEDDENDEDYVPGASPSSPQIEHGSGSSPQDQQAHGSEEDDVGRLAGDVSGRRKNDDMVYLCRWRSGEPKGTCDAVVASKDELHGHILSHHLACH